MNKTIIGFIGSIARRIECFSQVVAFLFVVMFLCSSSYAGSGLYNIYLKNGKTLSDYELYKSKTDPSLLIAKKGKTRIELKKASIDSYKLISGQQVNSKRPIGTVVLDKEGFLIDAIGKATVWQIVTTNNNVTGYHGYMALDSGECGASSEIDKGTYNTSTGFMTLEYNSFRYPELRVDLITLKDTFKISGRKVINKNGQISGSFYPNKFLLNSNVTVPKAQGCTNIWGDSSNKVYYTKKSRFFKKKPYSNKVVFFCSEQDARRAGYKKSLN